MESHRDAKRSSPRRLSPWERIGQGIERMIHPSEPPPSPGGRGWLPDVRILDKRREIVIRLFSPKIDLRQIHLSLSGDRLTFSAAAPHLIPGDPSYRGFKRTVVLPPGVHREDLSARSSGRVLTVRVRKPSGRAQPGAARKVRDLMSRVVKFVTPETPVAEAAALLATFDIGSVPVCRDGEVVGILTDRDIAIRVAAASLNPALTSVGDVMTRNVITCSEEDDLVDVEQVMADEQIRRLPVVDRNRKLVVYLALARIARSEPDLRSGHVLRGVSEPGKPKALEPIPSDS